MILPLQVLVAALLPGFANVALRRGPPYFPDVPRPAVDGTPCPDAAHAHGYIALVLVVGAVTIGLTPTVRRRRRRH